MSKCCLSGEDETAHRETERSIKTGELSGEGSAALLSVFVSVLYRKGRREAHEIGYICLVYDKQSGKCAKRVYP